jgi:hypothetical protein
MARPKRSSPTAPASTVYTQFIALLKKAGCTYCAECRGHMYPDHREHVGALELDRHVSRVKIVAEFGVVVDAQKNSSDTPIALAEVA